MAPVTPHHQQFSIGVKALIVEDQHVLMLRRSDTHSWDLPGGRINEGESIHATIKREVAEELPHARVRSVGEIVHAQEADYLLPNRGHLMFLCFRIHATLPKPLLVSDEHEEVCWLTASQLKTMDIKEAFKAAALHVLETVA